MKKINENLSEILDIEPVSETDVQENYEIVESTKQENNTVSDDSTFARDNIKKLIEKGNNALDELIVLAKEEQTPRAFEVIAGLIDNMAKLNKDLLEIHKRESELVDKTTSKSQNINVDKAVVFTGSTTELLKIIKQNKEV